MTDGATSVRQFILEFFEKELEATGVRAQDVPDDFDLLMEGIIDSFGIIELIAGIQERYGVTIDLEQMDPDEVTVLGPLSRYIASAALPEGADASRPTK